MASVRIECLRCGDVRVLHPSSHQRLDGGECTRCSYVGWAASYELDEVSRGRLRTRPLERRRLYVA
jgi:DNA-directed RNA polymerase subunit RPC12/RpoP